MKAKFAFAAVVLGLIVSPAVTQAAIVINEFQYDDSGTDDREFVEIYNSGGAPVDISGWTVGGRDATTTNPIHTIPAATTIAAGGYYVIGNTGVANVNQVVGANSFENDTETIEIWNGTFGTSTLIDALVYEGSAPLPAGPAAIVAAEVGPQSYWANHQGVDVAGTPLRTKTTVARYTDGLDSNNNGRDLAMRPGTPGTANSTATMTHYSAPNVDSLADGTVVPGLTGSFVDARVATPGVVVAGLNPNPIPAPPQSSKMIVGWDGSGGGNGIVSDAIYAGGAQSFDIYAFLDTADLPVSTNAGGTEFRGSEATYFGLAGAIDAFTNLASVSGLVGVGAANSTVGTTGLAWYYEKVGVAPPISAGNTTTSEKLYLVDAGDGGNMNTEAANLTADEWVVLAEFDLSASPSDWHRLGIVIDAAGVGYAFFDGNIVPISTTPGLYGSFYVGYRENTQAGAVGVPGYVRPATFAVFVPEPSALLFGLVVCGLVGVGTTGRRPRAK